MNTLFNVEFFSDRTKNEYDFYIAEIKSPLPYLLEDIYLEVQFNNLKNSGRVSYEYSHPNGSTNGYTIGFIREGKFESIKTAII